LIYITKYVEGGNPLVIDLMIKTGKKLIDECEVTMKSVGKLKAHDDAEGTGYKELKEKFELTYKRLTNF